MAFSYEEAESLIGKSRDEYQCNHVVNEALTGSKTGPKAVDYLFWGSQTMTPGAGTVVVGKDGKHVGIFIDNTHFIHSSSSMHKVIKADLLQLQYVFPKGYIFRKK